MRRKFLLSMFTLLLCTNVIGVRGLYAQTTVSAADDLKTAIEAGGEVTLGADITLSETVVIPSGKAVVLDLNGKTITSTLGTAIKNIGTFTVKDSGTGGTINARVRNEKVMTLESGSIHYNDSYPVYTFGSGSKFTMNGGSVTNAAPTSELGNGNQYTSAAAIVSNANANIELNAGTVTSVYMTGWPTTLAINGATVEYGLRSVSKNDLTITAGDICTQGGSVTINTSGTVSITGGTFRQDISEYLTGNSVLLDNGDGTYSVVDGYFQVGEVYYATLADAFNAAAAGQTITLLSNIALEDETFTIADGKSITLDMNGKKITVTDNKTENYELFYIYGGMTVTGGGTIELTATNNREWNAMSAIFHNRGGELTINNGTFTHKGGTDMAYVIDNSGNHFGDATTIIDNGTLTSTYTAIRNRMEENSHGASGTAYLTVNDGTIEGNTSAIWAQAASTSETSPATGEIEIKGGTIGVVNTARSTGAECMTTISGGTVEKVKCEVGELTVTGGTVNQVEILTSEGEPADYVVTEDGLYTTAVAKVNDTNYATLEEAIKAAAPSGTVEILSDVTVDKWIMFSETLNAGSGQIITINIDGLTIDGKDHTITINSIESAGNGGYLIFDATNLNVKDLTINYADGLVGGIGLSSGTISNVTFNGGNYGVFPGASGVTIDNCKFNGTKSSAVYYEEGRQGIVVKNNIFNTADGAYAIIMRSNEQFTDNTIDKGRVNIANSSSATVTGNNFGQERFKVYNAATATIENNEINVLAFNDNSVVFSTFGGNTLSQEAQAVLDAASFPVAQIGTTKYGTLQAAIGAVQNGETIELLSDVTENVTLTEATGLYYTIDGGGKNMNGKITVKSLSDTNDNRRITISNINFVEETNANVDFISSVETNHYPRLTVEGCTFTGSGNNGDVAIRLKSSHSVVIKECTGTGLHSFLQNTSGWNLTINNVTVTESKGGLALGTVQGVTVIGSNIDVNGYGIRLDAQYNNNAVIESNKVKAFIPVVVRKAEVVSSITFSGTNTMTASNEDGLWCAIGTSEYETSGTMPTAPTGQVTVTLNDTGLSMDGVYGNYYEFSGEGTAENPYLINNLYELKYFRDDVNGGNNYAGKYVKLTADIDLNNEEWTPIGNITYNTPQYKPVDASKVFSGVFDGNNKVIYNLTINKTVGGADTQANVGFFGMTGEGAVIKNLTLTNVEITTDGRNVGALIGYTYMATIDNITVNGKIQINGGNNVSGVGGMSRYYAMSATNIKVEGNDVSAIVGNNIVGGIFAEIAPNNSEQEFDGLNVENVAITGVGGVGGIVGLLTTGTVENVSVKDVVLTGKTEYQNNAMGRIRLGSVAGLMGGKYATIANETVENVTAKNLDGDAVELPVIGANYDASIGNATEAKIGNTYYATLAAAINAATAEANTITLLNNVDGAVTIAADDQITLDLNGNTVTSAGSTITVQGGQLTIQDNSTDKDGKIISTTTGDAEAIAVKSGGTVNLESGNIVSSCAGIYVYSSGGNVNISGGAITINEDANPSRCGIALGGEGAVNITGGTFNLSTLNYYPIHKWEKGTISLTGGKYDFEPNSDYIPNGYLAEAIEGEDGWFEIIAVDPMITIEDGASYYKLSDAFAAAGENAVITINRAGNYVWPNDTIPTGVTVKATVEGVVATSDGTTIINATTLTVENINFNAINHAAQVNNGRVNELSFTNCSFTGVYAFHVDSAAEGAELNFNNCQFNGFTTFATTVGTVNVAGGSVNDAFILRQDATIIGVDFSAESVIQLGTTDEVTGANLTISDCTVDGEDATANLIAEHNVADDNGNTVVLDGTVIYGGVAKIGDVRYATLADALDNVQTSETKTIELINEAAVEGTAQIPAGVTIKSNGKTINGDIRMLGNLTLDGPLTITGGLWVGVQDQMLEATLAGDKLTAYYFMFQRGTYTINADIEAVYGYLSFEGAFEVNSTITTSNTNGEPLYLNGNIDLNSGAAFNIKYLYLSNANTVLNVKEGANVTATGSVKLTAAGAQLTSAGNISGTISKVDGTTISISGGTYTQAIPQEWCAEGYICVNNNDGTYTVTEDQVATIDEVVYSTLKAAIKAAKEGETVVLIKDITENITIDNTLAITVDLNTYTVNGYFAPFAGNITVENGTINNTNSGYSAIEITSGVLVLEDVDIISARHALRVDGDVEVTINGGEYSLIPQSGMTQHVLNVSGTSVLTIEDGIFTGARGNTNEACGVLNIRENCSAIVNGGTFTNGVPNTIAGTGSKTLYGGTYDQDVTDYCAVGYASFANGDGTYSVLKVVAKINDVNYASLNAAIYEANADDIVVLQVNTTEQLVVRTGKDVTVDLNGKTINYVDAAAALIDGGKLTVVDNSTEANGKIVTNIDAVSVQNGGEFTLKSGNIEGGTYIVDIWNGLVTIEGGSVTASGDNKDAMLVAINTETAKLVVTGGIFTANDVNVPMHSYSLGGTVELKGGVYDFEPYTEFIASGYTLVERNDGKYTIEGTGIFVNDVQYSTITDAFKAVGENGTVEIRKPGTYTWPNQLSSVEIPSGVTVSATVDGVVATSDGINNFNATTLTVNNIDFVAIIKAAFVDSDEVKNLTFNDCSFTATATDDDGNDLYAFQVNLAADESVITFNNCSFDGFTTFGGTLGTVDVNGGNVDGGFVVRQDATIDDVVFTEKSRVQVGTIDVVDTNIILELTTCKVGDNSATVDLINYNDNLADERGNSVIIDGVVVYGGVAKIDEVRYTTLQAAVDAVEDGGIITLIANETFTEDNRTNSSGSWYEGLFYNGDKSFTIDLGGFTIAQDGSVNDRMLLFKNEGTKANVITLKNGTINAGTDAYSAVCTASNSTQVITINTENINIIGAKSGGPVLLSRCNAVLNVKDGTIITGQDSYLGIECSNATVNIYDGAEINMNGTSSYNGCLVGVGGNGTVNVYGGSGTGVKGGFIAMTSGGTINVEGGEWIANTDGTPANGNTSVLIAQNDPGDYAGAGASIVNVTGGTFRGGYNCYSLNGGSSELNISGGNFNADPSDPSDYVEDGFKAFFDEGSQIYYVRMVSGTHTISLDEGWNWFSTYVDLSTHNGLGKLQTALGENGVQIKTQGNQFSFYQNNQWNSSAGFTSLYNEKMYMIQTTNDVNVELSGSVIDYANTVIVLNKGWNWISYPLYVNTEVNEALKNMSPSEGDIIKGYADNTTSTYYTSDDPAIPSAWWPSITLNPGQGYMYKSKTNTSFRYTAGNGSSAKVDSRDNNYWVAAKSQYANNMTIIAMLSIDNEIVKGDYEIAAFANGECRGSARPIYNEYLDAYVLLLTVYGDEVEELTFKYYDVNYGTEYELSNRINYSNDAVVGSIDEPYMFNLDILNIGETSVENISIYPNPTTTGSEINLQAVCDKVEVFNALGVKVAEYTNVDSIDAIETAGIYVIRATVNNEIKHCRLIVK